MLAAALASLCALSAASAQDATVPWPEMERFFAPPDEYKGKLGEHRPLLRFDDGSPVRTASDWPRRRDEILRYWHRAMGAWPPLIEKPRVKELAKEHVETFTRRKVEVEIAAGEMAVLYLLVLRALPPETPVSTPIMGYRTSTWLIVARASASFGGERADGAEIDRRPVPPTGQILCRFLFLGGNGIEPPAGSCGADPTGHDLSCASFPACG
jgi:hypothetical protein